MTKRDRSPARRLADDFADIYRRNLENGFVLCTSGSEYYSFSFEHKNSGVEFFQKDTVQVNGETVAIDVYRKITARSWRDLLPKIKKAKA